MIDGGLTGEGHGEELERAVRALIEDEGLDEFAEALIARVRAGWALRPAGTIGGLSKIGGAPDCVAIDGWPEGRTGLQTFLAQIDTSALPALPAPFGGVTWPRTDVIISVFADYHEALMWRGRACVSESKATATARAQQSPSTGRPPGGTVWVLPETYVTPVPMLTLPDVMPGLRENGWDISDTAERYQRLQSRLRTGGGERDVEGRFAHQIHQFLGEAISVQDDVRLSARMMIGEPLEMSRLGLDIGSELDDPDEWVPLLGLQSDDALGLSFGDGGSLHVLAPAQDLAQGRLDRLICDVSSG